MIQLKNNIIQGQHKKPILIDAFYTESLIKKPILIFCHGYKGFKDWGPWNLMAHFFAKAGFCFVKFNFSHNGGTANQPIDFPDLEAFGNNNYTKELNDLESVIDWVISNPEILKVSDIKKISLIGHSRGGGIVTIKAEEDPRIKNVISLAGVCDFGKRTATIGDLKTWKERGVKYIENSRTKQQMPHYYQFYEDFKKNEKRLTIERATKLLKIPHLIIHGDSDTSVSINEAKNLHNWNPKSKLKIIDGANHVFQTYHPWKKESLSKELLEAVNTVIDFIKI